MPYIKVEDRDWFEKHQYKYMITAGELNFALTMLCKQYIENLGESYQTYNDIIGALEGCKMELYRRKVAPYEDTKIESNGDVY